MKNKQITPKTKQKSQKQKKGLSRDRVAQEVTPQAQQTPGMDGMLAIYRPIDEGHAGTLEDPVPWVYGMDCLAGTYYSYNGDIYLVEPGGNMIPCTWPPDTAGMWQWKKITNK